MCSTDILDNFLDDDCNMKNQKQEELIQFIIKDNDDMALLFRDIGERAKETLQGPDQKEHIKNYKAAFQQKSQEFKQLQDELCDLTKLYSNEQETIKKTKSKIIDQKAYLEKLEMKLSSYDEDDYETQESKEQQRRLKNKVKRLEIENLELSQQIEISVKSLVEQQEDMEKNVNQNTELVEQKKELEILQEEVTQKHLCLKESLDEKDTLIETIKTSIYNHKCEGKDITLRIENLMKKTEADEAQFKHKKEVVYELEIRENTMRSQVNELEVDNKKWQHILLELSREERSLRLQLHDKQQLLGQLKQQLWKLIAKVNLCKRCKLMDNQDSCEIKEKSSFITDSCSVESTINSSSECVRRNQMKQVAKQQKDSCEQNFSSDAELLPYA